MTISRCRTCRGTHFVPSVSVVRMDEAGRREYPSMKPCPDCKGGEVLPVPARSYGPLDRMRLASGEREDS